MNDAGWKERVQDYLDDRMDAGQRAAFEAELSRHPERAAEVERNRELGALLREEEIDLPPGLTRRARARFETSRQPTRSSRMRWAWPAAALAGAAMLLLTFGIFVPTPDDGGIESPEPTRVARAQTPKQKVATPPPEVAQDKLEEAEVDPQFAPAPAPPSAAPARSAVEADLRASVTTGDDELTGQQGWQAEPEGEVDDDRKTKVDAIGKSQPRTKSSIGAGAVDTAGRRDASSARNREFAANLPSPSAALEQSTMAGFRLESRVDPGRHLVDDPQLLARWFETEPILRQIGFDPRQQRLVLVGGLAEAFSCASLRLASEADGYRLVGPSPDNLRLEESGGERSCALALPRDGQPVRLAPDAPQ